MKNLSAFLLSVALCGCVAEPPTKRQPSQRELDEAAFDAKVEKHRQESKAKESSAREALGKARTEYLQRTNVSAQVKLGIELQTAIVGMTKEEVKFCYGEPWEISTLMATTGSSEVWRYGSSKTVFFTDGKVTAVHETKRTR